MAGELPNVGADVILEFQQSINNIQLFGQAMEGLDKKFGSMEQRINGMRTSLGAMKTEMTKGSGSNLREHITKELNSVIDGNGIVLGKIGTKAFKVDKTTLSNVFDKVERELNLKLAEAYKNINLSLSPNLQVGKIPIGHDDFNEVNKAIGRLVRVQLNNLVSALRKHGANMVSAEDLAGLQFHIGKGTVQQIINKVKDHIKQVMLNPTLGEARFNMTDADFNKVFTSMKTKIKDAMDDAVRRVNSSTPESITPANMQLIYNAINKEAKEYVTSVTSGINTLSSSSMTKPLAQVSKQLQKSMANSLGMSLTDFQNQFKNHQFTNADLSTADLRRQFQRLEQALNKKIGGSLNEEVKEMVRDIEAVQVSYSPKLRRHLIQEIGRINNAIVKKIREQIDIQFRHMEAEIGSVSVNPKDVNRLRRVQNMGRVQSDHSGSHGESGSRRQLANDPYARRDDHMSGMGMTGAITNTFRHIIAGSVVGAPMMLLYQAMESFKSTQLEQVKMFSNLMLKDEYKKTDSSGNTTSDIDFSKVNMDIQGVKPYLDNVAEFYGMKQTDTYQVGSIGARVSDNIPQLQKFVDVVAQIRAIDYEADPVSQIAPGVEAMKGQFGLAIGEMQDRLVKPLAVATNKTNASTAQVLEAMKRSGAAFKEANISPEYAVAFASVTAQQTGMGGATTGNFYSNSLKRLSAPESKEYITKQLGIDIYNKDTGVMRDGSQILMDIAKKYNEAPDASARDTISKVFGSYQGTRGAATLDAMSSQYGGIDKLAEIIKSYQDWGILDESGSSVAYQRGESEFGQMMQNQTQANVIQMDRAGVSMDLAITAIMEEFSPAIVKVAQELTQMSRAVRDNKQAVAGFVGFLGSMLLGLAAFKGGQFLYNKSGIKERTADMHTKDKLYGNRSAVSAWRRQGMMGDLDLGPNGKHLTDSNWDNRKFMNKALKDKDLAPYVRNLANMSKDDTARMNDYIKRNGIDVTNHKELLMASEESRSHRMPETDPLKRQGNAANAASKLSHPNSTAVDHDFMNNLASDLRDKQKFDALGQDPSGRGGRVIDMFSGMDDREIAGFNNHMEELHRRSGHQVRDFDSLEHAIDSYRRHLRSTRDEMRRTSGEFNRMDDAMNRLNRQSLRQRGANGAGGLSAWGRGAVGALGGLAINGLMAGAAGLAMAVGGEFIKGTAYNITTTAEERDLDEKTRAVQDVNQVMKNIHMNGWNRSMQAGVEMWNGLSDMFKEGDAETDAGNIVKTQSEIEDFIKKKYGEDILDDSKGSKYRGLDADESLKKFIEDKTKETENDAAPFTEKQFIIDFLNDGDEGSRAAELKKLQQKKYKEEYDKQIQDSIDQAKLNEEVTAAREKRYNEAKAKGNYTYYNFDERNTSVQDQVKGIETKNNLETLNALIGGMSDDSTEYLAMRQRQSHELRAVYRAEIDELQNMIDDLKSRKADAEAKGDTKTASELGNQLKGLEDAQKQANSEWATKDAESRLEDKNTAFDNRVNKVTRDLGLIDNKFGLKDTMNQLTMDRNSNEYIDASVENETGKIQAMKTQLEQLKAAATDDAELKKLEPQLEQLKTTIEQSRVKIRDLSLQRIGVYKTDMNDQLEGISLDYLKAKVDSKITDDNNPYLRNLRVDQYDKQVGIFAENIATLQKQLDSTKDPEAVKSIQREIRDLQRQSLTAQLGILDEMKSTGATFNLPDNVQAMSYYEYLTRNNTHSSYTVQGGDTNVTITLPNITDGTSADRIKQIGKAFGEGMHEGKNLRLQKQANPFGYRGGI